jgi:hypothetical protein
VPIPVPPTPTPTATPTATLSPTATNTPIPCSIFGCGALFQPVDWGSNHISQPNAVDLVPVGVTNGPPLYLVSSSNANWPNSFPTTVLALVGGTVQVLMPPPDRTCNGCGDVRIRTAEGVCYQYKHVVPNVSTGAIVAANASIGVVIARDSDPAPGVGAGDTSHLHLDRYMCDSAFLFTGNVTGNIREIIPYLLP